MFNLYCIKNKINGKIYIGQTCRPIKQRFWEHMKPSRSKVSILTNAIQKYGKENFEIELIKQVKTKKEINELEFYYIKMFNTITPNGYNLTFGSEGHVFTEEECNKRKERRKLQLPPIPKGSKQNPEWIEKRISGKRKIIEAKHELTGQITIFKSISDAVKFLNTSSDSGIRYGIKRNKSTYGYHWKIV